MLYDDANDANVGSWLSDALDRANDWQKKFHRRILGDKPWKKIAGGAGVAAAAVTAPYWAPAVATGAQHLGAAAGPLSGLFQQFQGKPPPNLQPYAQTQITIAQQRLDPVWIVGGFAGLYLLLKD